MNSQENLNTDWRKVASTIYKKPVDSKIFGQSEIDVTDIEKFVSQQRMNGLKITLTHIFALIIGRCLKTQTPQLNTYIRRGKIKSRPSVDAMVSVLQADGGMGSVKVENVSGMTLTGLEKLLKQEISRSRKGDENQNMKKKDILASIPWPFRYWFFKLYSLFTIKWGMSIPGLGISPHSFGSFVLTNIGSIGLDTGFPALLPSSNVAFVFVMGGIQKKPVVINNEIVIRRMMSITVVIDHRLADASHGGTLLRFIKDAIRKPEDLL